MLNKLPYGIILGIIMLLIGIKNFKSISGKRKFDYVNNCIRNNIRYRDIICTYLLLLDLIGATFTLLLLPLAERESA
jgi:hypothetical protein